MRPVRVELEGFSAFREPTVVDFTDADLFAFVGPTGAGKSSVIDGMVFALYGSGWAVSAAMSGQKWLWWPAIGGWIAAPILAWFVNDPAMWLVYAAGLILLALVPGAILRRQEPSDVV